MLWPGGAAALDLAADVIFLGEQHDNPAHHARQAELVAQIAPTALVFEMLTPDQAARVTPALIADPDVLEQVLDWANSGWPDFDMYAPIFAAAPGAQILGAQVPRSVARSLMQTPLAEAFGADASRFGLDQALDEPQQTAREALQQAAHCDAMPNDMLPLMVNIQRLRDGALARAALEGLTATGGPVVVITGNGHARKDWGAPALLAMAAPQATIAALGQGETTGGPPLGQFDSVETAPDVDRGDPCAAFRTSD